MKALTIIMGVLMCIMGGCAMAMPFRTFLGIGWFVGALFIVYGIQTAVGALKKEKKDVWSCIVGVLAAILGLIITFNGVQRVLTDFMITYLIGFALVLYGVLRLVNTYKLFKIKEKKEAVITALCGLVSLIGGIFAVGHPIMTMISVGFIIAFNLFTQGISMILLACLHKNNEA